MKITVRGIHIYFIGFLFMGLNMVYGAYFQAIEASTLSTAISMLRGVGLIVLGLLILPNLFLADGVWMTVPFAEIITLILAIIFSNKLTKPV
jgi:Na+-driven multidrug efflux pump